MTDMTPTHPTQASVGEVRHTHGCCAAKHCTDKTCMELPQGMTCGHCVHERRCCLIFGHKPSDTYCDWFPRLFRARATSLPNEANHDDV